MWMRNFLKNYKWPLIIGGSALAVIGLTQLPKIAFKNANTYNDFIRDATKGTNVPYVVAKAIMATESSFNANAQATTTSARGLWQLTKAAASDVGADYNMLYDPQYNISAGVKYLSRLITSYGLLGGISAYYQGGGNYRKHSDNDTSNDNVSLKIEASAYVSKVMLYALAFLTDGVKNIL